MKHLSILHWQLCAKNGLSVSYSLDGLDVKYLALNNKQTSTILFDLGLIHGRKFCGECIFISLYDEWYSWELFCMLMSIDLTGDEIYKIVNRHLENDAIKNACFTLLSFKEPCLN